MPRVLDLFLVDAYAPHIGRCYRVPYLLLVDAFTVSHMVDAIASLIIGIHMMIHNKIYKKIIKG